MAEALRQIHAAGVIHRDLKPSNIVLAEGTPVVIDFGVAAAAEASALTATGAILGSAGWMAPEQVRGETTTPASDVFAWGAVVAYAASGTLPFGTGAGHAVAYRIINEEPTIGPLDEPLGSLVRAALTKDPAARPSVDELVRTLSDGEEPTQVISRTWVGPPRLHRSRLRLCYRLAGVAAGCGPSLPPW